MSGSQRAAARKRKADDTAAARAFGESERVWRIATRRTLRPTAEERHVDLVAFAGAALRYMALGPCANEHELHLALYNAQRLHLGRVLRPFEAEDLAIVSRRVWAALTMVDDVRRAA